MVFSFPVMLSSMLVALGVLTVRSRFDDPDMWWHLKTGEIIWTTHTIPTADLFSWTTNHHARVAPEWLAQLLIYAAYRMGGYTGLMLWLCFATALLLIAGYLLCWLYSGNAKVSFVGAMTVWLFATIGLAVRPQMVGYLFLIVELLLVELGRTRNPRWLLWLPPLFAVWVNCHASFFLGLMVAGIFLFCSFFDFRVGSLASLRWEPRRRRMLTLALILSAAAIWLNPGGPSQILFPVNSMFHQPIIMHYVEEWFPLSMNSPRGIGLMGAFGCVFLLLTVRRSELFLSELVLLASGTWLAVSHRRMLFVFGILAAPILSRLLAPCWDNYNRQRDRPLPNALLLAASLLVVFVAFPTRQSLQTQVKEASPVKAVEFMETHHLSGRMLNEFVYGGYLIWAAPDHPVFVDGRADVFEWTGVFFKYAQWETLQTDPDALLDNYGVGFCLLARSSPMAHVLPLLPGWRLVFSGANAVIFARSAESGR